MWISFEGGHTSSKVSETFLWQILIPTLKQTVVSRFRSKVVGNVNSSGGPSNLSSEEIRYLEKQRQEHKLGILLVTFELLQENVNCLAFVHVDRVRID